MTTLPIIKVSWPPPGGGAPQPKPVEVSADVAENVSRIPASSGQGRPNKGSDRSLLLGGRRDPDDGLIEYDGLWIDVDDYLDLIRPRNIPEPCPCCGLRLRHTPICDELRWRGTLPFGKHKGKQFHSIPQSYLHWLLDNKIHLPDDLRQEIVDEMSYRRTGSRATPKTSEEFEERLAIMFEDEAQIDLTFPPPDQLKDTRSDQQSD